MASKADDTVAHANELYEKEAWEELYKFLKEALADAENQQPEVYWRMARACRDMANNSKDKEQKKKFTFEAFEYSTKGVEKDPENAYCNKWQGILLDLTARYEGTKKRIENSYLVKDHLEKAIKLKPDDATTLHSLGVWCFEFADLPWYQKKLASAFFATPPESSYEEGLKYFLEAEKISPKFYSYNLVYLGKTYLRMGNKEKAREVLKECQSLELKGSDDQEALKEANDLLKKC